MKGFSLVELLVAMLITLVVSGAVLSFMSPAQDAFQVQPEFADLQQRLRVGVDSLQHEMLMAGAGSYASGAVGPLHHVIAPIMPYRAFGAASGPATGVYFRNDTISLIHVPSTPSQTTLVESLAPGALDLDLDSPPNCPRSAASQVCGFEAGDRVLVFDNSGYWDVFEADSVDGIGQRLRRSEDAATQGFRAGSTVTEVKAATYSLKADPDAGAFQLVRSEGRGSALPVVDNVVKLEFQYFGDPWPPRLLEDLPAGLSEPRTTYGARPPSLVESDGTWPPGENCMFIVVEGRHEPRLDTLAAGTGLVEITPALLSDGPWCPDASARNRFDADLLRIRRVRFTLRVQTALASLRGPAGTLFMRGGTARASGRLVPDMQIHFDVTPRNLNLAR